MNLKKFILILLTFYISLFIILPHTEYQPADPGIKILQIRDFIDSKFTGFSANYRAKDIDTEHKLFPVKPPFAYKINSESYYVFPFFLSIVLSPFYMLGGVYALDFLSLMSGLLIILLCFHISNLLDLSHKFRNLMLVFIAFGSINSIYSFVLGEAIHSSLLITFAYFLILKAKNENSNPIFNFLAGLLTGLSVLFRIELALYCILLFIAIFVFKIFKHYSDLIALFLGLFIPACVLVVSNYIVTENILGLRGIEFLNYSGASYPIENRFFNLIKAFFGSDKALGLFTAWPIFLFVIPFIYYNKLTKVTPEHKSLLFITCIFTFLVPILVKNPDGSILGPRFAATVQPLLIIGTFKSIELLFEIEKFKFLISKIKYLIGFSIFITCLGYVVLFLFLKTSKDINLAIDSHITGNLIILTDEDLYNCVLPSFAKKPIIGISNESDIKTFLNSHKQKIPTSITIISSSIKTGSLIPLKLDNEYAEGESFTKKGILVQNFLLKSEPKPLK
ncbi:MAG: hypothetical protein SH817_12630 [Leptospira sp.]|nr:hypothetical protein [Leptospira sp.]